MNQFCFWPRAVTAINYLKTFAYNYDNSYKGYCHISKYIRISLTFYLSDAIPIPKIDLVFAVSAVAANAKDTFNKIKEAFNNIIVKLGTSSLHFGFVVFGNTATARLEIGERFNDIESLKRLIGVFSPLSGTPNIKRGLEAAKRLFSGPYARSDAKKVVVLITDKGSR